MDNIKLLTVHRKEPRIMNNKKKFVRRSFKDQTIKRISEALIFEIRTHNEINKKGKIDLDDIVQFLRTEYDNPQKIDY